ncbi:MAG: hypothetical protein ABEJ40_11990 [Haloarculaceae archaeon]
MRPTRPDAMVFVYTLGAVLSGGLLAAQIGIQGNLPLVLVSTLAAAAWTVYFRVTVLPRLETELVEDDEEDDDRPGEELPTTERGRRP